MFNRIVASVAVALVDYLLRRIERGNIAVDGDIDRDRLRRGGSRIREWMHENGASPRIKPDSDGAADRGQDLHPR